MKKKDIFILLVLGFIWYYTVKVNTAEKLDYRIIRISNFRFESALEMRFNMEIMCINPTSVSINLQNANLDLQISGTSIGRGVLLDDSSIKTFGYPIEENDNQYLVQRFEQQRLNGLTRIQANGESPFHVGCYVKVTDLLLSLGGVIKDWENKQIRCRLVGIVRAELISVPIDVEIFIRIPKFL